MKVQSHQTQPLLGRAECTECSWMAQSREGEIEDLRSDIRKHVRATGHKVSLHTDRKIDYYILKEHTP